MTQTQILSRNQQIVLDIIEKAKALLKAYSILFNVQKRINAPQQIYRALDKLIKIGKIHKIESKNALLLVQVLIVKFLKDLFLYVKNVK